MALKVGVLNIVLMELDSMYSYFDTLLYLSFRIVFFTQPERNTN